MMSIKASELVEFDLIDRIAKHFNLGGTIQSFQKIGSGHIHRTFLLKSQTDAILVQNINHSVFSDLEALQTNLRVIEMHFSKYDEILFEKGMTYLKLREANDKTLLKDGLHYWRAFEWIESSESFDKALSPKYAYQAAVGFGQFIKTLSTLPLSAISLTIPDFHNGKRRWNEFEKALEKADANRYHLARALIDFAQHRKNILISFSEKIENGLIPIRLTHNDTKLNNILFHKGIAKVKCIIDLDTVMPGTILFDFGDMIRTICSTANEDCENLESVEIDEEYFTAICKGFASEIKDLITKNEQQELLNGAIFMCFIIGIRFLTDYLNGNIYYPIDYENHNLIRARNQFKLVSLLEDREETWQKIISQAFIS